MPQRVANAEQSRRTREALLRAARDLFADPGYGATGTEQIVARAGLTRGALYHHFRDKRELFEAVVETVERDLAAELAAGVAGPGEPAALLRAAARRFLEICQRPEVRRITLLDAPSVLGWAKWREIDGRHGLGLLRGLLRLAAERGLIDVEAVEPLSHLFLGAVVEAALAIAHAPGEPAVERRMLESIEWLIDRMLTAPPR